MKRKTKRWICSFLTVGLVLTGMVPAQAYTKPQEAEEILQGGYAKDEQAYQIYPIPQSVDYEPGEFQITQEVNIVCEDGIDTYTKAFLEEILEKYGRTVTESSSAVSGKSNILLGTDGSDQAAVQWSALHSSIEDDQLFDRTDAYFLDAENGDVAIIGKDTDAVYCGLATLQMMFSSFAGDRFLNVEIEDYADMAVRGFIEGFYGGWDYPSRESLMRFARDFKMNTYVYASKTDPYHTSGTLYPQSQINQIRELVKVGKETKVEYAWSMHLSWFFSSLQNLTVGSDAYNTAFEANYTKLIAKFQQLYDAGVRKFDILNDDFGAGSHAEVVRLLNKIDEEFLQPKGCERMSYCPQGYNQAWSGDGSELAALKNLSENIDIYWTGSDVNSPITQETVDFLRSRTNHEPVFWLNYPVNEHGPSGIYLGDITHYARDGVTGLAGAVSNPSRFAEANKVGLFQLAALFWNNDNYLEHAQEIWEESFKYLQPEVYDAYLTIAGNVSNCPGSGRVPAGFPESEYLKDSLNQVSAALDAGQEIGKMDETQELLNEFAHIQSAVSGFRQKCSNTNLISELDPWLTSLNDVAAAGESALRSVIAIQNGDANASWKELGTASKAMDTYDTYPTYSGSAKSALSGSKYLVPFVNRMITAAKNMLTPYLNPSSKEFTPSLYAVLGGQTKSDDSESAKIFDGDETTYGSYQVIQQQGDYFGVDLGRVLPVHSISILQGKTDTDHDYFHNGCLEYSKDGEHWTTIAENVDAHKMSISDISIQARFIRLRLTKTGTASKPDYWTFIREFAVNQEKEDDFGVIGSAQEREATVTMEDKTYTMSPVKVQLASGEYIGIKMKELTGIAGVECTVVQGMSGLKLQYSENGAVWKDAPADFSGESARYVRIWNTSQATKDIQIEKLAVTVTNVAIHPSVIESSFAQLKEGSWENLFDGNTATYAWTNTAQKTGQYILVDLGATAPVYDIQITTEDGNPRFYNAKIQVSTDKTNWEDIAEVVDGGKDAVRENIFYRIKKNLEGKQVRYLKILITGDTGYYLKICDIDINKTVQSENAQISGNVNGDFEKMTDGSISTVFTASDLSDGTAFIEYKITENTRMDSVTFLQDASEITGAQVSAEIYNGSAVETRVLGILDAGSKTFALNPQEDVLSFKIVWPEGTRPVIYEIITAAKTDAGEEGEETVFPSGKQVYRLAKENFTAVTVPYGTEMKDISLPDEMEVTYGDGSTETLGLSWKSAEYQAYRAGSYVLKGYPMMPDGSYNHAGLYVQLDVTVEENTEGEDRFPDVDNGNLVLNGKVTESGSGLHPVENAVDGDAETRWEGNTIKGGAATTTSWIAADLGSGKKISVHTIKVSFYLKTYATDYDVQVSDNGDDWVTVETVQNEDGDTRDLINEIVLEEPAEGRYIRLFFRSMNANAAGNAVGIRELEVIGSRSSQVEPPEPPVLECSCRIENLVFDDIAVRIPADDSSASAELKASAELAGGCEVDGHAGSKITCSYRILEDLNQVGSLNGNVLTVAKNGVMKIQVTAKAEGTDAAEVTKTAVVTVTKEIKEAETEPETEKKPVPKPAAVTGLKTVSNKTKSIQLSWNAVSGVQGYLVSRYDTKKKTWKDIADVTAAGCTDAGVKAAAEYQYRVRAYVKDENTRIEGPSSEILRTATAPVKTTLKVKKLGKGKVKLSWNRKANADGFEIFMKTGKKAYKRILSKGKKVTSCNKSGLKKGITYQFRLRSYKKVAGKKIYSEYSKAGKVKF